MFHFLENWTRTQHREQHDCIVTLASLETVFVVQCDQSINQCLQ